MRDDEEKHAEILLETRDSIPFVVLVSEADRMMWNNVLRVKHILSKELTESILNLDDAYELAHEIESSEISAIFKFLSLEFFSSPVREAFIASEIRDHQGKLVAFSERFGAKEWRKTMKVENF
jgi:hypothetical protein